MYISFVMFPFEWSLSLFFLVFWKQFPPKFPLFPFCLFMELSKFLCARSCLLKDKLVSKTNHGLIKIPIPSPLLFHASLKNLLFDFRKYLSFLGGQRWISVTVVFIPSSIYVLPDAFNNNTKLIIFIFYVRCAYF